MQVSNPNIILDPIQSSPRTLSDWVTNFHLVLVALDPFRYESSWILDTARQILRTFYQADCRTAWLVAGDSQQAQAFLGPLSQEFLTFADPSREAIKSLGIEQLPAFLHINHSPEVTGSAQGWNPIQWRAVANNLALAMKWKPPIIPMPNDPAPFQGSSV